MEEAFRFITPEAIRVPSGMMTRLALEAVGRRSDDLKCTGDAVHFLERGWFEVLLTVAWDPEATEGTRFSHTNIPDVHPLHSEAINAEALAKISNGRQLLRGNTVFDPDGPSEIFLEVWHDADAPVQIKHAELAVRPLG
jgi:hypothetical protein